MNFAQAAVCSEPCCPPLFSDAPCTFPFAPGYPAPPGTSSGAQFEVPNAIQLLADKVRRAACDSDPTIVEYAMTIGIADRNPGGIRERWVSSIRSF